MSTSEHSVFEEIFRYGIENIKEEYSKMGFKEGFKAGYDKALSRIDERKELNIFRAALIEEGQLNSSKYGFKLGDTIKFTPDEVVDIIKKRLSEDRKDDVFNL